MKTAIRSALVVLTVCTGVHADTKEVLDQIRALAAQVNSYTVEVSHSANLGGMSMNFGGSTQRKGSMIESKMRMDMFGESMASRSVIDAAGTTWIEMDANGEKEVAKFSGSSIEQSMLGDALTGGFAGAMSGYPQDLCKVLDQYLTKYEIALDHEDTVDGVEVYVFKGGLLPALRQQYPNAGSSDEMGFACMLMGIADTVTIEIGKTDGFPRKIVLLDKNGNPLFTTVYKNIQLNASIDDAVFVYVPPDGVNVEDVGAEGLNPEDFKELNDALNDNSFEEEAERILQEENP